MKHLVTISFVLFSLTHLAHAERVEGLRILHEYCKEHRISINAADETAVQFKEHPDSYFLSATNFASAGTQPQLKSIKYGRANQVIVDLAVTRKPKNNSP